MSRKSTRKRLKRKIRIFWNKTSLTNSFWFEKFLKCLVKKGKMELIFKTLLKSTFLLKGITVMPFFTFFEAFDKAKPAVSLSLCRKGENFYRIPQGMQEYKSCRLGVKWLALAINDKGLGSKVKTKSKISTELLKLILDNKGQVIQKLEITHKIALANRANVDYRWQTFL